MSHKSGFVNIIGNPNVGKSTLMNALVGEKLSIITKKAQTTRHRLMGIVNGEDFQIVYSDTPGIVDPHYKLHEYMMKYIESALLDADIFLLVTEIGETFAHEEVIRRMKDSKIPVIVIINKIDNSNQEFVMATMKQWSERIPGCDVIPTSALNKFNMELVFDTIIKHLPESPAYYSKEQLTDKSERFFVSEIIREKILIHYKKEVPYSTEVVIDAFKEEEKIIRIIAIIFVARDTQKAIMIGHQGRALKRVGTEARIDMEEFFDKKVYLEMTVKVNKDWRDKDIHLKRFGYNQ